MTQIKNDKPLYENEKYQIFNDKNGKYVLKLKKGKKVLDINIVLISLYYITLPMDISAAEQSCEPWAVYWKRKKMSVTCGLDFTPLDSSTPTATIGYGIKRSVVV